MVSLFLKCGLLTARAHVLSQWRDRNMQNIDVIGKAWPENRRGRGWYN